MKRVLLVAHKFFPGHCAGTEVLTLKVAQELVRRGYEVLVVAGNPPDRDARHADGPETSDYAFEGVPVHVVEEPLRLKGYTFKHEYWHPGIAEHFDAVLDRFAPDLVHLFHAQNLSASIIDVTRRKGVPVVLSAMNFWFVCPVVQLRRPDGTICRGPAPYAANCLTCYTPQLFPPVQEFAEAVGKKYRSIASMVKNMPGPLQKLTMGGLYGTYIASKVPAAVAATVERPGVLTEIVNRLQAIMVPTMVMSELFVENGIRPDLIQHVPFGIDTAPLVPYQTKTESDILRIGFIGTFFEHKGVDLLIDAFQKLAADGKAKLTLYGDLDQFPEYGQRLRAMADRPTANSSKTFASRYCSCPPNSHSSKIEFAGTFPNDRLGEVLSSIDVLVVPSRWYENTPLVIQSALATKTPVMATNLGGMSELVKHEVNGLLFRLNDADSLAEQLARLINEPPLLAKLRDNILPERTIAEMVDDIESIYQRVGSAARNGSASGSAVEHRGTMVG